MNTIVLHLRDSTRRIVELHQDIFGDDSINLSGVIYVYSGMHGVWPANLPLYKEERQPHIVTIKQLKEIL